MPFGQAGAVLGRSCTPGCPQGRPGRGGNAAAVGEPALGCGELHGLVRFN